MNPFNWKLAAVAAAVLLSAGVGGAVLLAGGPDNHPVREPIKAPVPKVEAMEWVEGKPIELDGGPITGVAVSSDGKLIALTQRGKVTLLEADTRKQRFAIAQNLAPTVTAVAFNPKGDKIAFTTTNSVDIRGVDIKDPGESWEMKGFDPNQVAWLTEDSMVATNGEKVLWRLTGKIKGGMEWDILGGRRGQPAPVATIPGEGQRLLTNGRTPDDKYTLIDVSAEETGLNWTSKTKLSGHKARPVAAVVAADGKRIVSADEGGTLIVWEGEKLAFEEKRRVELGEGVVQIALAPDGKTVAVVRAFPSKAILGGGFGARTDLELHLFDVTDPPAKPKPLWATGDNPLPGKLDGPVSLVFAPDGKTLYAAFADPFASAGKNDRLKSMGVKVWTLGERQIKAPVPKAVPMEWKEGKAFEFDGAGIQCVEYSPDGKLVAVAQQGHVTVLAADTRKTQYEIKQTEPGAITGVAFSPKGDKLAVTRKNAVDICEAATSKGIETWETKELNPHQVIWFTDKEGGEHLVATNGLDTRHRDGKGKEKVYHDRWPRGHEPGVLTAIPGANAWLMCCQDPDEKAEPEGDEFAIQIGNAGNTKLRQLKGHKQPASAAAVTTDGKWIATADVTGLVIVWDAETGKEQRRFELTRGIQRLAFAPDGKTLAVLLCDTNQTLQSDPPQWNGDLEVYLIDITDPPKEPKPLWRSDSHGYTGQPSLAFSPDGKTLLAAFCDRGDDEKKTKSMGVKVWELVPKK